MRGPQTEALRRSLHLSIDPSPYHKDSTNGHPSSAESAASPIMSTRASVATTNYNPHISMLASDDGNEWRICTVLCLYDFRSEDQDHLCFKKGDILDIVTQEDTGWWAAMRRGGTRVGWIPGSFVQPLAEDTAKTWANVEKELQIWSPDAPQLWRRDTGRRYSEFSVADSQATSQYDGDADEEIVSFV
jgi:son of sevenless-like protein